MSQRITDREKPLLDMAKNADYATVCEIAEILSARYSFLDVSSIGETILQKKLLMLSVGNKKAEKSVLYVATHSGSQWICANVILRFINELCEYYKNSKQPFGINLQTMLSSRCLYFIPLLNADGADIQINGISKDCIMYDRMMAMSKGDFCGWNANCRGVDLCHNYDSGFYDYKKCERENNIVPGAAGYAGESPFSEPESGALANYLRFNDNMRAVISLQSSGEEIYYTSGGYAPGGAKSIAQTLSRLCGYKIRDSKEENSNGSFADWFIKEFDRPAFVVKCGKDQTPINVRKYFEIYASIREMLFSLPLLV